jgi:septal ring factor EnvC (AmiA/AmiB activator)
MINSAFNNIIASSMLAIQQAEEKLNQSTSGPGIKNFKPQVLSQLPSQGTIQKQLLSEVKNTDDLKNIESKKNQIVAKANILKTNVADKRKIIKNIQKETNKITEQFNILDERVDIANKFVPEVRLLVIASQATLALLGGIGSGLAIIKLADIIKAVKSKLDALDATLKVIPGVKSYILSKSEPINNNCNQALSVLDDIDNQISDQINYTEAVWNQISTFFSDKLDLDTLDTNNPPTSPDIIFDIDSLENSGKETFIQDIESSPIPTSTGYRIIKK